MQWDIALADLSQGGCRIEDPHARLQLGEDVRLYIAGTGPHLAKVVWRQGTRVGLEFARSLPERVLSQLAAAASDGAREGLPGHHNAASVRRVF